MERRECSQVMISVLMVALLVSVLLEPYVYQIQPYRIKITISIFLASVLILKLNTMQLLFRKCVALVLIYNWKKQFNIYNRRDIYYLYQKGFKNVYSPI